MSQLVITGHRGTLATEPENTMRSFRRAVADGADEIELDVHLTRDGHLVVMHDKTVDRTTNGTGAIAELTFAEIRALDAGLGEQVPEFIEVWRDLPAIPLQVEVKDAAATAAVLEIATAEPREGITITSFHPEAVTQALNTPGSWRVGLIAGVGQEAKLVEHLTDDMALMIHWSLAETAPVKEFRASGGWIAVWPSRTPEEVTRALDEGWSGTTADDTGMAIATRNAWLAARSTAAGTPG